jgi:uncharacterized membrane protein (DUF106 family)
MVISHKGQGAKKSFCSPLSCSSSLSLPFFFFLWDKLGETATPQVIPFFVFISLLNYSSILFFEDDSSTSHKILVLASAIL